jgi:hypothetical protein
MTTENPRRVQMLEAAIQHTNGARNTEYGTPYNNLTASALLQSAYLVSKFRGQKVDERTLVLTAEDAAWLMVLTKISRTFAGAVKADTYEDAAAYAAIAGECAEIEKED